MFFVALGLTGVRDCFDRYIAPHWMQDFFCLELVPACVLKTRSRVGMEK